MNWTGSVSAGAEARPAWSCVTGDQVTSTEELGNPNRKRLSFSSRKPVYPCGNGGTGRLSPIMRPSFGPDASGPPPTLRRDLRPAQYSKSRKQPNFRINPAGCSVQVIGYCFVAKYRSAPRVGRRHE